MCGWYGSVFKWTVWFIRTIQVGTVPQKQKGPKKFEIFQVPSYKTQKKILALQKKIFVGRGGVYTIENKNTNTDYQKVVRVEDQKWEIVETTLEIIFFFEIHIQYFLYRDFLSPTWKKINPTWKVNSHPKSQFDVIPSYIYTLWKMAQPPPPPPPLHHQGREGANYGTFTLPTKIIIFIISHQSKLLILFPNLTTFGCLRLTANFQKPLLQSNNRFGCQKGLFNVEKWWKITFSIRNVAKIV